MPKAKKSAEKPKAVVCKCGSGKSPVECCEVVCSCGSGKKASECCCK